MQRAAFLGGILLVLAAPLTAAASRDTLIEVRGRIQCLETDEESCNHLDARFAFHSDKGATLHFLATDPFVEMFSDPTVRERYLHLSGWLRDGDKIELHAVHSIKNGTLHHIHYRCDVCDITATAPGPCWCCGQPFELREVPVDPDTGP